MARRRVGAAVVLDPDGQGPGIITERDVLDAIGAGQDPDAERVADHLTADLVFAAPDWSLEEAAVRDGARRLPPPHRHRGRRDRRDPVDARRRALLDRRRRDLRRARERRLRRGGGLTRPVLGPTTHPRRPPRAGRSTVRA